MIPYGKQLIDSKDIESVKKALLSDWLTTGPLVEKFEKEIKKKTKSKFALAVNSATSALHLACMALDLKKGDYVWTTPNTFVSTANVALLCGAKVDFIDIELENYNLCTENLEKKLKKTPKKKLPKIVIPVHFGGHPCEMKKIQELSKKYKFKIIEDASHSIGAQYKNEKVGSCRWSDITVFSFHPVKIITTFEGGAALTNKNEIYKKLKMYSNHGITKNKKDFSNKKKGKWYYEQKFLGLNYRMTDVAASLGTSQIKKLNKFVNARNKIANKYAKLLNNKYIILPNIKNNTKSSFHLYVIKLRDEYNYLHEKLFNYLRKNKFNVNLHYIPVHLHPYYRKIGYKSGMFINAEKHAKSSISLPIYPGLENKNINNISKLINNFFNKNVKK